MTNKPSYPGNNGIRKIQCLLALEDGKTFMGQGFGATGTSFFVVTGTDTSVTTATPSER